MTTGGGAAELTAALRFVCECRDRGWAKVGRGGPGGMNQGLNNYPSASAPEEYALPQIRSTQRGSAWLLSGSFLPAAPPHCQSQSQTQPSLAQSRNKSTHTRTRLLWLSNCTAQVHC